MSEFKKLLARAKAGVEVCSCKETDYLCPDCEKLARIVEVLLDKFGGMANAYNERRILFDVIEKINLIAEECNA